MNAKRLLKLADFLDKLPRKKFDYNYVVDGDDKPRKTLDCGSTGCAIGWCPVVFPRLAEYTGPAGFIDVRFKGDSASNAHFHDRVGSQLFGISDREALALFTPMFQDQIGEPDLSGNATPKQVAALIRRFVAKKSKATSK